MDTKFKDTDEALGMVLSRTAESIKSEAITLQQLLNLIGEQGLLTFCIILCLPFLLPVSIPGVSTVFGIVIILIGIGITLNRIPWLPARFMNHELQREHLVPVLEKGSHYAQRIEHWIHPRLATLTERNLVSRMNGLAIILGGILLLFPFGFVPFSNTLPALAILFLAIGMIERDGVFVIVGYLFLLATMIYFGGLLWGVYMGGHALLTS